MPQPALRQRIRVRHEDGTVMELDRDPAREVGELVTADALAWPGAPVKFLVTAKSLAPGSDVEPSEIVYEVRPLGA
ncbi:MAG: hypothetical protein VKO64_02750 [Candidatus Sericytochromatia bacterium]|nr:hypothetical protein [Candidatus Sericytochromatia bacterium]